MKKITQRHFFIPILIGVIILISACSRRTNIDSMTDGTGFTSNAVPPTASTSVQEISTVSTNVPVTTKMRTSEVIQQTNTDEGSPLIQIATPNEIKAEEQRLKSLMSSLDVEKISKIEIEVGIHTRKNGFQLVAYESDSQETIQTWVDLFQRMEISADQDEIIMGGGMNINVYDKNGKTRIGSFVGGCYIKNSSRKTMCLIDNYDELYPEIQKAVQMVNKKISF